MFDDIYVEFDNASATCQEMGARYESLECSLTQIHAYTILDCFFPRSDRLPVLDSPETITTVKKYLEESNFTVFEVILFNQL